MPFYVSPEQVMRDKDDYARKGVARSRSSVVLQYTGGILMVTPNASSVLHKISELYDRIAFAAVGRYNEYENLRKAGVTYADVTGYQFDRSDVTARGIANWYAQTLGTIFSDRPESPSRSRSWSPRSASPRTPTRSTGSPGPARSPTSRVSWRSAARPTRSPRCSRSGSPTAWRWPRRSAPRSPRSPSPIRGTAPSPS